MGCYYNQYHRKHTISWIFPQVNSKDGVDFAMLWGVLLFMVVTLSCHGGRLQIFNFCSDQLSFLFDPC
jgi:hypothetical protein